MGESAHQRTAGVIVIMGAGAGIAIGYVTGNLASWTAIGTAIGVAFAGMLGRPKPNPARQ
jgi:hypothetical protein